MIVNHVFHIANAVIYDKQIVLELFITICCKTYVLFISDMYSFYMSIYVELNYLLFLICHFCIVLCFGKFYVLKILLYWQLIPSYMLESSSEW